MMSPQEAFNIISQVLDRAVIQVPFGETGMINQAMSVLQQVVTPPTTTKKGNE